MDALAELDREINAVVAGVPTPIPDAENLTLLANAVRRLCVQYSQEEKIQGFTFEVNGVDATHARTNWPADVLTKQPVVVRVSVAPPGQSLPNMKAEFIVGNTVVTAGGAMELSDAAEPEGDGHDDFFKVDHEAKNAN